MSQLVQEGLEVALVVRSQLSGHGCCLRVADASEGLCDLFAPEGGHEGRRNADAEVVAVALLDQVGNSFFHRCHPADSPIGAPLWEGMWEGFGTGWWEKTQR